MISQNDIHELVKERIDSIEEVTLYYGDIDGLEPPIIIHTIHEEMEFDILSISIYAEMNNSILLKIGEHIFHVNEDRLRRDSYLESILSYLERKLLSEKLSIEAYVFKQYINRGLMHVEELDYIIREVKTKKRDNLIEKVLNNE